MLIVDRRSNCKLYKYIMYVGVLKIQKYRGTLHPIKNDSMEKNTRKRKCVEISYDKKYTETIKNDCIKWEPENWKIMLENIKTMRKQFDAPVDTMGCDKCADNNETPLVRRFHSLIALMLSSQTKDQTTFAAMKRLRDYGLTVENIVQIDEDELGKIIIPVSFWKTKAKHIKATAQILKDEYQGDIPNTIELLCKLPGVGPKMAHICMQTAWGIISGIGVDTHVHRIANRLRFVQSPTSNPESTRRSLESWLPKELWSEINLLLVGFGQQICKPVSPNCESCLNNKLCPFAQSNTGRHNTE